MIHTESNKERLKQFTSILWPILMTQVLMFSMNLVDTMMSGKAGVNDLAGVAIGSSLWSPILTGISGILMALTAIVAQHMGANEKNQVAFKVYQAYYIAIFLAITVAVFLWVFLDRILTFMNLDVEVHHIAYHYLIALLIGIIPLFLYNSTRNFIDAQGLTRVSLYIIAMSLPINILLNYSLIFGQFGMPKLGGIGAGYASAITYWIIFFIAVIMTFKMELLKQYQLFRKLYKPSISAMIHHLKMGIPIGVLIFVETSIFSLMTLLIGVMFSTQIIAANQVVLNFTTLLFMIPLSISMAMTIVVGFSVGGNRFDNAKAYTRLGVILSLIIIVFTMTVLYFFRAPIAYLYTDDPRVVEIAMSIFLLAMVFQLSDAFQAVFQGVLRGYKDVTIPSIIAIISYWGIGLLSGYLLAAYTDLGVHGFWVGIILGLSSAAIGFYIRLKYIEKNV